MDHARRRLLLAAAGLCGLSLAGPARPAASTAKLARNPFALGVAAGEPEAGGFVIWTRLLADGGPPLPEAVEVQWELAQDERFERGVRRGRAPAQSAWGHSVHIEIDGLEAAREYWYRFEAGGHRSPAGRARTLPARGAMPAALRLAFASCQHYEMGYYAAYRHLSADAPELVLHLGDYIYESSVREPLRPHESAQQPHTLEQYRARYAHYKRDPDLQAAHASCAWLVTWDDHEVDNDYAALEPAYATDRFALRRAAAYQAYWEHMPLRMSARPVAGAMRLYRQARCGALLNLQLLDGRQYRSDQACATETARGGQVLDDHCAARLDPARTLLGPQQERWLLRNLERSDARWNVLAQQMLMARLDQKPGDGHAWWSDGWDGYPAARDRILQHLASRRVANPVVLGGDIHSFWANDLKLDFDDARAAPLASEFVGTSISSSGVPYDSFAAMLPDNPHVRFFDSRHRGYARCTVTRDLWRTDFVALDDVRDAASGARVLASFAVAAGAPGVHRA